MVRVSATVFDGTQIIYAFTDNTKAYIFIKHMEQLALLRNISFDYKFLEG